MTAEPLPAPPDLPLAPTTLETTPLARLRAHGVGSLTDAELVAVLLGSKDLAKARALLQPHGLPSLLRHAWEPLVRERVVTLTERARIVAAIELNRRIHGVLPPETDPVRDPETLARPLLARYAHHVQERLGAVFLDAKNRVLREREVYIGTLNATTVSTRDVFRLALEEHAAAVVVFHNHPSGDPAPSAEDLLFTKKLVDAGRVMSIDVMDHLILGHHRYVSLKARGAM